MKTNKSYTKRIRVTRNKKLIARTPGHGHFNSRESGRDNLSKHRTQHVRFMSNKQKSRFLA